MIVREMVTARILAAYERTGLRHATAYRHQYAVDDGPDYACGVGAVCINEQPHRVSIGGIDDLTPFGEKRTKCVEYGFDDAIDADIHTRDTNGECPGCGANRCPYYEGGAAAAIAMEAP